MSKRASSMASLDCHSKDFFLGSFNFTHFVIALYLMMYSFVNRLNFPHTETCKQNKLAMVHFSPLKLAKIKKIDHVQCWPEGRETTYFHKLFVVD